MKKTHITLILFALLAFFAACGSGNSSGKGAEISDIHNPASPEGVSQKENENMPVLTFEKTTHDFGRVIQGERLTYAFKFKNTGKSNLIISNTSASCGCTTSIPPKEPIRPGESGEIKVTFDSKRKHGNVKNSVVVAANTYPVNTVLTITAEVIEP
ncbi:MAG: DUF1573 domain-containing protein [Bacteroidales bacterium]|nr:DUF1573 domain-containing protein [Bacteroidales bacterium]